MASVVNIHEAKTHLSRLVERAEHGEEIVIARAGTPVAMLSPLHVGAGEPRRPGAWKGKVVLHEDFHDADAEIAALFDGTES